MKLSDLLNSHMGTAFGLGLSRIIPPRLGYPLARNIADLISSLRRTQMVRAVRANQCVVHGGRIPPGQLDTLVQETFRSSARSLYEFWHNFRNPRAVLEMVEFEPSFMECIERAKSGKSGTLLVTPHMCNFDLVGRAFTLRGLETQVLSYPMPPGGYRWQNQIRQMPGMLVTPMSMEALRMASQTLRAGKVVLTGVDRPLPSPEDSKYRLRFFDRLANMPVFHIRLAIKQNIPITVLGGCRKSDGRYRVWASAPIPMQRSADLVQETVQNAETVLNVISENIRRAPEQWAMYYPVWPEVLEHA
jgi:KDO2-lipid IV(A) lauroyltransferase